VRLQAALLDTSIVIDLDDPVVLAALPESSAVSAVTLAELAAGPHAASDPNERARRQQRLQLVEAGFDPLPFDASAARAYGLVYAAVRAAKRQPRRRLADLLIAATAHANSLPLLTRNPEDFAGVEHLVAVHAV
jgi:predicted nucleic acid-binding protein